MVTTNSLGISFGKIFFPIFLAGLGWWLIIKSPSHPFLDNLTINLVGETNIDDTGDIENKSIAAIAGDFDADFRDVVLPAGETVVQYACIACDVDIRIPKNFPIKIITNTIVTKSNVDGIEAENIFSGYQYESEEFNDAKNRIVIRFSSVAIDMDITNY
jgi:predicted membrane protein